MLILGIETSGTQGSVALCCEDEVLAHVRFPEGYRHAREIMSAVDRAVRAAGVGRHDVQAVAVSKRPGSFTGLRVGVTCAKTLAFALRWQVIGVPSLAVAAQNVRPDEFGVTAVCPLRDARRAFVHGTVFRWDQGAWADSTGVLAGEPPDVAARIPAGALVFGSGVEAYPETFCGTAGQPAPFQVGPASLDVGRAEHVARLGAELLRLRGPVDPMKLTARYYRRTEAEEKFLPASS